MDPVRQNVHDMLARCEDRLRLRIRWMIGEQARRHAGTRNFLNDLAVRILEQAGELRWRDEAHFLALATRIARHLVVDEARRPRLQRLASFTTSIGTQAEQSAVTPSRGAAEGEAVDRLLAALDSLPEDYQRAIELRHFEELSFEEIGARLGRSANAAQLLHQRALARLGRMLGAP